MCKPVFNLKKKVDSEIEFYLEQEKKLIERYSAKDENGHPKFLAGGRIELNDMDSKIAFEKEITNLRDLDIDGIDVVEVSASEFREDSILPSPNDLLILEDLIKFID